MIQQESRNQPWEPNQVSTRNLPPLEVGCAYLATDFDHFEYCNRALLGKGAQKSILRLHLKNGTTIDLPAGDEDLQYLAAVLAESFGTHVIARLKELKWV